MDIYQHKVQYYETDKMGITHHSNYVRWMEEARTDFLEQIGFSYAKLEEMGIISPVTQVSCTYKKTTTFSDVIVINVKVEEFKGVRLKLKYEMLDESGALVCAATSQHCFLNQDGRLIRLKKEFPDLCSIFEKLSQASN